LEVSRRTIFRDLNMLEMARVPYYFNGETGGYTIQRSFFLPPINLTLPEALAILMLTGRMREAKRLPLLAHSAKAAIKLESALPPAVREHVGSVMDKLAVWMPAVSRHEGLDAIFDELTRAVVDRKVCRLVYLSFQERRQLLLTVQPLRLVFIGRAWYLIAYSTTHREIRTFKLGRIRKLTATSRVFPPREVDLEKHFGQAWSMIPEGRLHDVHLRFEPRVAGNVAEVQWHATQRVEWNDDGSAEFRVRVDGLGEIAWWILGYGDQVTVVEPVELRRRVAAAAAAVARKYAGEGA
jgi:proteasome accessory factor B